MSSGPTYTAQSTTRDGVTTGTFTFLSRQDRHALDMAARITGRTIKRGQFRTGEPIAFTRTHLGA